MKTNRKEALKADVLQILQQNILPYWIRLADKEHGGFYGQVNGKEQLNKEAHKGGVLHARILWTFSAAYRILKEDVYLQMATHAKEFLLNKFWDKENGGIYWTLDYKGNPVDTKKQIYAQGFAIYGLSEYHRATGDKEALAVAIELFKLIEKHSFDKHQNGYWEAFKKDWSPIEDMRLSEKDENSVKTMNTHLHILEPYTNLYRIWKDETLKKQQQNLIKVFLHHILNPKTYHLNLFFDNNWNNQKQIISYGHDIEASWLLHEAALELNNKELLTQIEEIVPKIVQASEEGLQPDGSMIYEKNEETYHTDFDRHWWVQAEAVIGFLNQYQHFNDETSFEKALACWHYIKTKLIDTKNGEWFWSILSNGSPNHTDDKAGLWKCPYHNGRMCLEVLERL